MKNNIPGPKGDEKEADRLIASYGAKPAPEKRQEIMKDLQAQKEQFLTQEREKAHAKERSA